MVTQKGSYTLSAVIDYSMVATVNAELPQLSGLSLAEQASSSLSGQVIYGDSGGAGNVSYRGLETIQNPDITAYAGNAALSGDDKGLIKFATWNQDGPYNDLCPIDPSTKKRSAVGCTATAAAQVLYFWKATKSISFTSSDKYVSKAGKGDSIVINIDQDAARLGFPDFKALSSKLSSIKYDFSDAEKAAVSFGVGVKLKMSYSSALSGAYISSCVNAFKSDFGFISAGALSVPKDKQFSDEYLSVIIDNVQKGQPVITGISTIGQEGGHAVIIDGYRASDKTFHVNMGWGGTSDNWYSIKAIDDFNQIDDYLIDVFPTGKANETYTVTNTNDYGVGSLRRVLEMANNKTGVDTIVFDAALQGKTITLTSGQLQIKEGVNILGLGQKNLTISGGWSGGSSKTGSDIFYVGGDGYKGINVTISGLTLTGAKSDQGGAIYNDAKLSLQNICITNSLSSDYGGALCNQGTLTASGLTISGNKAVNGGGIANAGAFTLTDSRISGNAATNNGGGIINLTGGTFKSINCTIAENTAKLYGGGIFNDASLELTNSIVSGNKSLIDKDISGQVAVSSKNNLVSDGGTSKLVNNVNGNKVGTSSKLLDPGFVKSQDAAAGSDDAGYELLATSVAVNAGDNSAPAGDLDLAGNSRLNGNVDIGAYEFQGNDNVDPSAPAGLAATVTGQSVAFDWNDASDGFGTVSGYEMEVDQQKDFKSPEYYMSFADSSGLIADIPGGSYFWRVRAEDSAGNFSSWSSVSTFASTPADTAGNTLKTALNIDDGVDDWTGLSDACDIYKLTMAHNGLLNLNLTGLEDNLNLYLLDGRGNVINSSANNGVLDEAVSNKVLQAGEYYVKVQAAGNSVSSYYDLTHVVNYFPDDTAGNSFAAAGSIPATGTFNEWVGFGDKYDYYKLTLTNAGTLTLGLTGLTGNADLALFNAAGTALKSSAKAGTSDEAISNVMLQAGTYYVRIAAGAGVNDAAYTLTSTTGYFDGDTKDHAGNSIAAAKLIDRPMQTGWVGLGDKYDYYKLTLTNAGTLTLGLTGLTGNADLALFNAAGTALKSSAKAGTSDEAISNVMLQAGTYYVRIAAGAGVNDAAYTLTSTTGYFDGDTKDHAGNSIAAAKLIDGPVQTGWVGLGDSDDYYRFDLATAAQATLRLHDITGGNADLLLYNVKGVLLKGSVKPGTLEDTLISSLAAGTYYARVHAVSGNIDYNLDFSKKDIVSGKLAG